MGDHDSRLPVGIRDFEELIREGYLYVDKTAYMHALVHDGKLFFLNRPAGFGKSLLISALRAYWEGKQALFAHLAIGKLEEDNPDAWQPHPVFCFDFDRPGLRRRYALEDLLEEHLAGWEKTYGAKCGTASLAERFRCLLVSAANQSGKGVVVLADAYDRPMLDAMEEEGLPAHNEAVLADFFGVLNREEKSIRFAFAAGVTGLGKATFAGGSERMRDLSLDSRFAGICGFTEAELLELIAAAGETIACGAGGFSENKDAEGPQWQCSSPENGGGAGDQTGYGEMYGGFRFHPSAESLYHPAALLRALQKREHVTGEGAAAVLPFLEKMLKADLPQPVSLAHEAVLADIRTLLYCGYEQPDPVSLLYQTGILTIAGADERRMRYTLYYPNAARKYALLECLAPAYCFDKNNSAMADIYALDASLEQGRTEELREYFRKLFSRLPFTTDAEVSGQHFLHLVETVFLLLGRYAHTNTQKTEKGVLSVTETEAYVYLFCFRQGGTAAQAMRAVDEMGLPAAYADDERRCVKIGAVYDRGQCALTDWQVLVRVLQA